MGQSTQENVTKCNSSNPDARIAGCTALIQSGLLATVKAGLLTSGGQSTIYNNRGDAYKVKGDYVHAIEDFSEAIRLKPTAELSYYQRGSSYKKKGDYDRAIQDFNTALYLNPKYELAYYDRGNTYINKEEYDLAIRDFVEAIHLKPDDAMAYNSLGVAYIRKDDYGNAIQNFSKTILLNPDYISAYGSRGSAYFCQSNFPAAIADFMHTISASPSSSGALYGALMLHVIMKREGRDDAQQLARVAAVTDLSKWPGPLLKLDMGQMTADEVLVAALGTGSDREKKWKACEANYFTGEDALLHKQRATALKRLKAAEDGCPKGELDYGAALAELKRIGSANAPAK
jgi:tetratricopeptide (TPR) repeat protein